MIFKFAFLSMISNTGTFDCKKVAFVGIIILVILITAAAVSIFVYYKTPCSFKKCMPKAHCVDSGFGGKCVCNKGYNGNGYDYCDECGVVFENNNLERIVGGKYAKSHSWPSTVQIFAYYMTLRNLENDDVDQGFDQVLIEHTSYCTGNLIDRRTVLTAAHCIKKEFEYEHKNKTYLIAIKPNEFYPTYESIFKVYVGSDKTITFYRDLKPVWVVNVNKAIAHEKYDDDTTLNDIGILKLDRALDLNKYVQVACLPDSVSNTYPGVDKKVFVAGWGLVSNLGRLASRLKNAQLTVYNSSLCARVYDIITKNWNSQICAGVYEGGVDTCHGDSGGPLFVNDTIYTSSKYILAGITSYGYECALAFLPGIYTRVSFYLDWIQGHMD